MDFNNRNERLALNTNEERIIKDRIRSKINRCGQRRRRSRRRLCHPTRPFYTHSPSRPLQTSTHSSSPRSTCLTAASLRQALRATRTYSDDRRRTGGIRFVKMLDMVIHGRQSDSGTAWLTDAGPGVRPSVCPDYNTPISVSTVRVLGVLVLGFLRPTDRPTERRAKQSRKRIKKSIQL